MQKFSSCSSVVWVREDDSVNEHQKGRAERKHAYRVGKIKEKKIPLTGLWNSDVHNSSY